MWILDLRFVGGVVCGCTLYIHVFVMFVGTILLNWYGHTLQAMPLLPNTSLLALRNFYGIASLLFCPKGRQVVQAWWFHSHTSGRYAANLDATDFSGEIPQTAAPSGRGWFQCPEQFANSAFARAVTGDASSRNLAQRVAHPEVVRGRQDFYSIVLGLGKLLAAKNFFANEGILLMRLPR